MSGDVDVFGRKGEAPGTKNRILRYVIKDCIVKDE